MSDRANIPHTLQLYGTVTFRLDYQLRANHPDNGLNDAGEGDEEANTPALVNPPRPHSIRYAYTYIYIIIIHLYSSTQYPTHVSADPRCSPKSPLFTRMMFCFTYLHI